MDTLLTFESSYEFYTNGSYTPNSWVPKDDRKIWHIVYRVPQDKVAEVLAISAKRHVEYLHLTDDDNPNPYDNVPNDAYMKGAMNGFSGGVVRKDAATTLGGSYIAGIPSDASVIASDYTSVTISWSAVPGALGYGVYLKGALVLEMPPSLTKAVVGMLKPGTSGLSFEVRTIISSGSGGRSKLLQASTNSLPAEGSITNVNFKKEGDMIIYNADILVPYAFIRLFIGGPHEAVGASKGWPIDAGKSTGSYTEYKLVNYMVEGNDFRSDLYKYTGAYVEGSKDNADWGWTPQAVMSQTQSGYTNTWRVPLGSTDALPDQYVVQGQGYAPIQNVMGGFLRSYKCGGKPCDDDPAYDCLGSSLCATPDFLKWCDLAVNSLVRTDDLTYGTGDGKPHGNCFGDSIRSCGVFLQKGDCAMSGNDMWHTYQNLRNLGGCEKCGSYKLANGCLFTVNYVYACKSADPGAAGGGGSPYDPPLFSQLLVEEVPSELPDKLEFPASPMTSIRPSRRGWA
ncbi:hypothetical protein WAI453_003019 [Rhynchosporium graminicola]